MCILLNHCCERLLTVKVRRVRHLMVPSLRRLAEREIEAISAGDWVRAFLEWVHAVIAQTGGPAPNEDVAVAYRNLVVLSERSSPPKRKTAGRPSETDTMGSSKSFSFLS